ncbi:MAG: aspartate kinase, partial [Thermodesulfobacteriota bacterium]
MALVVQKYGGTSVGDVERIRNVARRVLNTKKQGHEVVVVVSAMAGETDKLIRLAKQVTSNPDERETDVLISTGEQVSIALLAIALKDMGEDAKSYLGFQIKIATDSAFGKARITGIESEKMLQDLKNGRIVVVAGFQGVDESENITTLGRGGSDTTAVAIAAAVKADVCEIYTDVDGVYTTDPNICPRARKLQKISYDEMLEMASLGAKVLQIRSVEFAKKYDVPIHVRSSFNDNPGTIVCKEDEEMEKVVVSGVTYNKNEAKIEVM